MAEQINNWTLLKKQKRKRLFLENEFEDIFFESRSDEKRIMERIVNCEFGEFFHTTMFGLYSPKVTMTSVVEVVQAHDDIFVYSSLIGESYYLFQGLVEWAFENKIAGKRLFFFREKDNLRSALYEQFEEYDVNDPEVIKFLAERDDISHFREVFSNNQLFFLDTYDGH